MRLSLKGKLTALISLLVLFVVLGTSSLYISSLVRHALAGVQSRGESVAEEIYHQADTALEGAHMPPTTDPNNPQQVRDFVQQTLASNPGLRSLMESTVGYSATIYYVAITDPNRQVLVHNDPQMAGTLLAPADLYQGLLQAGLIHQLRVIYGPPQIFEVTLPLNLGNQPLGDVRVGVSTIFLGHQLAPDLRAAVILSGIAVILATLLAGMFSFHLLRPLETISRGVEQMARGDYTQALDLRRKDEWGILSSKLNLLGEQMRGEKAAYGALKENLDQLFSNLADGLLLFDQQDRLVVATPSAARFLGRALEPLRLHPAAEIFSADLPVEQLLRQAFLERQPVAGQVLEIPGEKEPLRVAVSVQFVEEAGARMAALVTLRDAGTRAQLENEMDLAAKWSAIGKLTSGVAHEVKNPLNAMVLQLEILKSKLQGADEGVEPQIETLSTEIRRLDRVVKTFLDFTRPVELRVVSTDLAGLVQEVFTLAEPQARQNNVRMVLTPDGTLPRLDLDPDLMKQALLNLVLNGCQAMKAGGELHVTPRTLPQRVELEIADQGPGIPAEVRPKLFSLFFTTKPGGTGVGLAMAYRIVQLHNGTLDFSSETNRGTTFRISLPRQS
jgi:signal transduction histidine kinase/HAMP domain-containing protein